MDSRTDISYIVIMGDSLTDRGTLANKMLFGCIPMSFVSGLQGIAPQGSFTNGYAWSDHLSAALANEFTIKKLQQEYGMKPEDIADAIITRDRKVSYAVDNYYNLQNDMSVEYRGTKFVRTYAEGGLTAHDYKWQPSTSIKRYFSRLILSTLEKKRNELLTEDKSQHISAIQKAETLVIEWCAANDFLTVNKRASILEADKAIAARSTNIVELIKNGYRQFVWFNMPDLSLTPRLQADTAAERQNAQACCDYFNKQLALERQKILADHPECTLEIFDISDEFTKMYRHPEKYNLDKNKLTIPYTESPEFKMNTNKTSPSNGSMFWDKLHPTADVHAILAYEFCKIFRAHFNFVAPKKNRIGFFHRPINDGVMQNDHHPHPQQPRR